MKATAFCYNPCFSGSSSATEGTAQQNSVRWFVTILVFLAALVQPRSSALMRIWRTIVTILVFLAALVQLSRRMSCRIWSGRHVTILVFLAALVQLSASPTSSIRQLSYNPCFSGSSSATYHTIWVYGSIR